MAEKETVASEIAATTITRIFGWNEWIARRLAVTRDRVFQIELGGLLAFGFTMMQIGEWALAIGCWVLLGCILFFKVATWEGVKGNNGLTILGQISFAGMILVLCALLITVTTLRKPGNEPWSNIQKWPRHTKPCSLTVDINSEIVARVHTRAMWHSPQHTDPYKPVFQDLYYDWVITLTPTGNIEKGSISIKDERKPTDTIRVSAANTSVVSDVIPGWLSGFYEPTQLPDFYSRTVSFPALSDLATITIRRPMKLKTGMNTMSSLDDLDLDRDIDVTVAGGCKVILPPDTPHGWWATPALMSHFRQLTDELQVLLAEKNFGGPVVTRPDPDQPYPPLSVNESEIVDELKCSRSSCDTLTLEMKERTRIQ